MSSLGCAENSKKQNKDKSPSPNEQKDISFRSSDCQSNKHGSFQFKPAIRRFLMDGKSYKKLTSHFWKNIVYQLSQDRHWYPQSESEDPSEAETEGKRKTGGTGGTGPGSEKPKIRERGGLGPAGIMVMAVIITVLILMLLLCCDCRKPKLSRMIRKKRIWSPKTKTSAH